jgi:hypothetical protein
MIAGKLVFMRLTSAIRGPLNPFQGDYLCSFVSIRG